jgi:PAS domain S-box-containing protein
MKPKRKEAAEVKRLKACINDLIGVVALPSIWSGGEALQIVNALIDILLDILGLEFICVRLKDPMGNVNIDIARAAPSRSLITLPHEIGEVLESLLDNGLEQWPPRLRTRIGGSDVSIAPLRLGPHGEIGMIAAGARRRDFPLQTERLVLSVAANQAMIALQEARLLKEQKQVADELDQRVTQRTLELSAANEELRREIVERRLAECERQRLASIVEGSNDFTAIIDAERRPVYVNEAGLRMIGLGGLALLGSVSAIELLFDEDRARLTEHIKNVTAGNGAWSGETRLCHLETGIRIPVLCHIFSIGEHALARASNFAVVCREISALKHAEANAQAAQAELARVNRLTTMGELAASIAHEIKQPLTAIVANGETCLRLLGRKSPDRVELRTALNSVIDDARRAAEITVGIRNMAKKVGSEQRRLDVNQVIETVLALTHREINNHQICLQTRLQPSLPPVSGDVVQLQQVVLNLIMNAVEAMAAPIELPRTLAVSSYSDSAGVAVAVTDSGGGVDPAIVDSIFDPFFTTKSTGMGLGLSICRSIVEDHGGHLWVEPSKPRGCTFRFILPFDLPTLS